jgi:hypothetical protein
MVYTEADFQRLVAALEDQGGQHLNDQCKAKTYRWTGTNEQPRVVEGCGNHMLLDVQYEPYQDGSVVQSVTVCAVDDNVGMWPRFRHAIKDSESN